ncbi:MAG: HPr family phosphocarrier protein [Clostridia bacterium]|nr:HPr family phosphocarrier protein [Clostridia bacterium]
MERLLIRLKTINDVRAFVDVSSTFKSTVILTCGNFSVSGKSIMGIFSLDLNEAVTVTIDGDDSVELVAALSPFICAQA